MLVVNSLQPVNMQHPLNRGLAAWWLAGVQGRTGGATWFDLVRNHRGTLTALDPKTDWVASRRATCTRALEFSAGSGESVVLPKSLSVRNQLAGTIAAWYKPTAAPAANAALYYESQLSAASTRFAIFQLSADSKTFGQYRDANNGSFSVTDTTALTNGVWYHLVLTVDSFSDRLVLYRDGVQRAVNTTAKVGFASDIPGNDIQIGRYGTASNTSINGQIDDVRLWYRALSATEVKAYYDLSRRGYPGLLNRIEPISAFVPAAPAAGRLHINLSGNLQSLVGGMQN